MEEPVFPNEVPGYDLGETLGAGKHGEVRRAVHIESGRTVAIKSMLKSSVAPEKSWSEVKAMQRLRHPNVVRLFDVIETSTHTLLVLEFLCRGELFDYLVSRTKLSEREAHKFVRQILRALSYCHSEGIVHRDLKLENLLLDEEETLKIADFGFSNMYNDNELMNTFAGTPSYAPPEIVMNERYPGPPADIWCLGIIIYTILVGNLPFQDENEAVLFQKIVHAQYDLPTFLSQDAKSLISGILKRSPDERLTLQQIWDHPWMRLFDNDSTGLDSIVQPVPQQIHQQVLQKMAALKYDINDVERQLTQPGFSKATATYHLLVDKYIADKKEAEKNAEIAERAAHLMRLLSVDEGKSSPNSLMKRDKLFLRPPTSEGAEYRERLGSAAARLQASSATESHDVSDRRSTLSQVSASGMKKLALLKAMHKKANEVDPETLRPVSFQPVITSSPSHSEQPQQQHQNTLGVPQTPEKPRTENSIFSFATPTTTRPIDTSLPTFRAPANQNKDDVRRSMTVSESNPNYRKLLQSRIRGTATDQQAQTQSQPTSLDNSTTDDEEALKQRLVKMRAGLKTRTSSIDRSRPTSHGIARSGSEKTTLGVHVDDKLPLSLPPAIDEEEDEAASPEPEPELELDSSSSTLAFSSLNTSSLPPAMIVEELIKALNKENIAYTLVGPHKLRCEAGGNAPSPVGGEAFRRKNSLTDETLIWDFEIIHVRKLGMQGVRFHRHSGNHAKIKQRLVRIYELAHL